VGGFWGGGGGVVWIGGGGGGGGGAFLSKVWFFFDKERDHLISVLTLKKINCGGFSLYVKFGSDFFKNLNPIIPILAHLFIIRTFGPDFKFGSHYMYTPRMLKNIYKVLQTN